jgi:hypothetical protein
MAVAPEHVEDIRGGDAIAREDIRAETPVFAG